LRVASGITSKPANEDHFKTGQRKRDRTSSFIPFPATAGNSFPQSERPDIY
jgi:hypothetical protein